MKKNYAAALLSSSMLLMMPLMVKSQTTNIDIGTGTGTTDNSPIQRFYDYSTSELLYMGSEVSNTGTITGLGFYKGSGATTTAIDSVYIYMKTTSVTALVTATDMTDYTLVYKGAFPNNVATGWCTISFTEVPGFTYNSTDENIAVLVVKPYQALVAARPFWRYTDGVGPRNAWYRNSTAAWSGTMAEVSNWRPNIRLTFGSPLPIVLGKIAVENVADKNVITWNTHKEAIGDAFELQRSNDGTAFAKIASLLAKGNGSADYKQEDLKPLNGKNYYRLKMTDIDGHIHYSEVVATFALLHNKTQVLRAYPSPAIHQLNVVTEGSGQLQLISMDGRIVRTKKAEVSGNTTINTSDISRGTYLLKYNNGNLSSTILITKE